MLVKYVFFTFDIDQAQINSEPYLACKELYIAVRRNYKTFTAVCQAST
jgi:hypothetical protein